MPSTVDTLALEAGRLLGLVQTLASADGGPRVLLGSLGWDLPPGAQDLGLAAMDISGLLQAIEDLDAARAAGTSGLELDARYATVLFELEQAIVHVHALVGGLQADQAYLDATNIKAEFFPRLTSFMAASRLAGASPVTFLLLQCFGILTVVPHNADPATFTVEHLRYTIKWDDIPRLFKDPVGLLERRYGWGTPAFAGVELVANLCSLAEAIGEPARLRRLPRRVEEQLAGHSVPEADTAPLTQLIASFVRGDEASGLDVGVSLFPLRPTTSGGADGGIAISPFVHGVADVRFPLSPDLTVAFDASVALDSGVALEFRPGQDPTLKAGLQTTNGILQAVSGSALVSLIYARGSTPVTLLEIPGGGFVRVDSITFSGGVEAAGQTIAPTVVVKLAGGHASLNWEGADSFLSSVAPAGGFNMTFDLAANWSATRGFTFQGSAAADLDIVLHFEIAGVRIDGLHLGVRPSDGTVVTEISVSGGASLGPLDIAFSRVGTLASFTFRDGNLGPLDLSLDFQPPQGVGLSLETAGVLTGGGFIYHDPVEGVYAGSLQLALHEELTLTAFGLIGTRMPDGTPGYSLIIFITAEDFEPVPLGLGFTLQGIGGLVAANRTFDQAALSRGMQNDTLKSLLFPANPVGNAPAIIRALATVFPAQRGSYLLGLLARIGWSTPTLVLMDLALMLEFGRRRRLLVLGRISALLPSADNDLVRLILDAVGVVDFDQGTASIDAQLVDSRLAHKFVLTGGMALRAHWRSGPGSGFVLAVGGFSPHFTPPDSVPVLPRVAIALSSGDNPRLTCQAYFAITSNTVQFGAHAELYAAAYGFSIQGDIGYDVLVQIAPLHFVADFSASVQLKHGSTNLFKVSVAGELEGPRPLRVSGKASFEILWCDFSVSFDRTLVNGELPPAPPAVDLTAELIVALARPQSWTAERGPGRTRAVSLRSLPPGDALILDPLGVLVVKQQLVPLDTGRDIDVFGGAPTTGARRFHLTASLNGQPQQTHPVYDQFAPAQFFAMTDDDKLAAPSFETMGAGVSFGADAASFDPTELVAAPLEYDEIVVDVAQPAVPSRPYQLPTAQLLACVSSGAAARAPVRNSGRARFRNSAGAPAASLRPPQWTLQPLGDGPAPTLDPTIKTWSDHLAALNSLNRGAGAFQIVPRYELAR